MSGVQPPAPHEALGDFVALLCGLGEGAAAPRTACAGDPFSAFFALSAGVDGAARGSGAGAAAAAAAGGGAGSGAGAWVAPGAAAAGASGAAVA